MIIIQMNLVQFIKGKEFMKHLGFLLIQTDIVFMKLFSIINFHGLIIKLLILDFLI